MSGDTVEIDDLAEPTFSEEVRPVLEFMDQAGASVDLDPSHLRARAIAETGLDDFGADDIWDRVSLLCGCFRDEAALAPRGRAMQDGLLVGLLKNRLLIEATVAAHPEILDIGIERPIIICGLPRTGTTHLHNLLAADPALRSLPYWESLEPVAPAGETGNEGRKERTRQALWFVDAVMPYFKRMHEMTVDHVHEEIQLLAIDFSSMLFETTAPIPTWRDAYLARDQRASYAYLRRVLQVLTWLRGGGRWVLKSPQHLEQFPALIDTFPDATFVVTHRDPVSVTASLTTMIAYSGRMVYDRVDTAAVGAYWSERIETMLRRAAEDRTVLPADQSIDVRFDDFMADDMAMVGRVYEAAGQPLTPEGRKNMQNFMDTHPRGRFGAIRYDMTRLDLDPSERRRALRFYSERFGVADE